MKKKDRKKKIDLDKVESGVKKVSQLTRITFRIVWTLLGVALIAGIVFLSVRCGQSCVSDVGSVLG